jgi:CubicO group peptidase (beta-lactamase class C family)
VLKLRVSSAWRLAPFSTLLLAFAWIGCMPVSAQNKQTMFTGAATADLSQKAFDQIDALTGEEFAKHPSAGVTVGVVSPKGLAWTKSYGLADVDRQIPASRDTVYRIGAVTKQFTALMLLQLAERGKVALSDPVERYVPEISQLNGKYQNASPITLLQLAMHTSGLAREPDDAQTYSGGPLSEWQKSLIMALSHAKYAAEPGTNFIYSGFGYGVLGLALSRAASQPYAEYMKHNIFDPLGMHHSAFEVTPEIQTSLAIGYEMKDGKPNSQKSSDELKGRGYNVPSDAMFTTVEDFAKYMSLEMLGGPESVLQTKTMQNNLSHGYFLFSNFAGGVGVGVQLGRFSDLIIAGHGGQLAGYRAQAYFRPDAPVGVIVMRNAEDGFQLDYVLNCLKVLAH